MPERRISKTPAQWYADLFAKGARKVPASGKGSGVAAATNDRKAGWTLLADIGGTNARFALTQGAEVGAITHVRAADFATVRDAMADFLARHPKAESIKAAVLAVAGPVTNNRCVMTNSPWVIDGAELRQAFGYDSVQLLNDFEALAWSLPDLKAADLFALGAHAHTVSEPGPEPRQESSQEPRLVLGPGTGFGVSCLVERNGVRLPIITEAGHATLPAESEREAQVIHQMRQRFGHVSIEQGALSGSGLRHLYEALADIEGTQAPKRDAAAITKAAIEGSCDLSRATLDMFCALLGSVAGNLAMTFGARGGVYIAGGIVPRFPDFLATSDFRRRFESKGRFQDYLRGIPTSIIVRPDASFVGLRAFCNR